jgi:hypothetical protein
MTASPSTWKSTTSSGSCISKYPTCADAVRDPAAFAEAYFDINHLSGASGFNSFAFWRRD